MMEVLWMMTRRKIWRNRNTRQINQYFEYLCSRRGFETNNIPGLDLDKVLSLSEPISVAFTFPFPPVILSRSCRFDSRFGSTTPSGNEDGPAPGESNHCSSPTTVHTSCSRPRSHYYNSQHGRTSENRRKPSRLRPYHRSWDSSPSS